jgi:isopenicillin-N N-acyltransferase-like protein
MSPSVQTVRISGGPEERGAELGRQAERQIRQSVDMYRATFAHYTGLSWGEVRERAAAFRPAIDAYDPELVPEMAATAAGAGVDLEDILAINTRTEVMYGLGAKMAPECTAFGARAEATRDGHVLLGQNWDWLPASVDNCILLEVEATGGPAFVTFVEAGLLAKIGFNDAGIGMVTNLLLTEEDQGDSSGVPFHVILRGILASATFDEAVGAITRARRASSGNFIVASAEGELVDLEVRPGGPEHVHRIEPTDDEVHHANSFCGPIGSARDRGAELLPCAPRRTRRLGELLADAHGRLDTELAKELLQDHDGLPTAICRHADESLHPLERVVTACSMVLDLTAARMEIAVRAPCQHAYEPMTPAFAGAVS